MLLSIGRRGRRQEEKGEGVVVQEQGGEISGRRRRSMLSRKGGVVTNGGRERGTGAGTRSCGLGGGMRSRKRRYGRGLLSIGYLWVAIGWEKRKEAGGERRGG
ncbi:hypothetical protein B296_00036581 [Ensete ventricosum]|uniref:Uncharacterized protein n=1 Tax=Ensete ventricosum TaxID=4639 RepID=A0A427A1Z5_ENSVE|nr:hypothetical protein B296_00036581 [Ensete ventricosum]